MSGCVSGEVKPPHWCVLGSSPQTVNPRGEATKADLEKQSPFFHTLRDEGTPRHGTSRLDASLLHLLHTLLFVHVQTFAL